MNQHESLDRDLIYQYAKDINYPLYVFDSIDSTNNYAKTLNPKQHGTLIVANHQFAGRGRSDHSFYSPKNSGVYCSLIVKPTQSIQDTLKVTVAAAVSTCYAIRENANVNPKIKWVNDIFIQHRKISGILTEALSEPNSNKIDTIIIGIGINCFSTKLPQEISNIAGAIDDPNLSRNKLVASLWKNLLYWINQLNTPSLINLYREDSLLINHNVSYQIGETIQYGKVIDINNEGNLIIQNQDNETIVLDAGEVSIKDW